MRARDVVVECIQQVMDPREHSSAKYLAPTSTKLVGCLAGALDMALDQMVSSGQGQMAEYIVESLRLHLVTRPLEQDIFGKEE